MPSDAPGSHYWRHRPASDEVIVNGCPDDHRAAVFSFGGYVEDGDA